jgi:threonine/homoserine/homoserine lactone efflux protein
VLTYLVLAGSYAFAAAVQPGPFQAYLIGLTLAHGWRRTIPAVLAPLVSDLPVILVALVLLTHVPPLMVQLLRLAGGLYLVYLSYGMLRSYRTYARPEGYPSNGAAVTLLKATAVNLLNPNPYLGWTLVMGPILLAAWSEGPVYGVWVIIIFYGTMIGATAALVALLSGARSLGPRVGRGLVGLSAAALLGFGAYQLWQAVAGLHH